MAYKPLALTNQKTMNSAEMQELLTTTFTKVEEAGPDAEFIVSMQISVWVGEKPKLTNN